MAPSLTITPTIRPNHEGRDQGSPSPENLIRHAHAILDKWGVALSPSKVTRLVRSYKHQVEPNGFAFADYLMNAVSLSCQQRADLLADVDFRTWYITYFDETGEDAVHKVLRERGY